MVMWYWSADTLFWQLSIDHDMEVQYQRFNSNQGGNCPVTPLPLPQSLYGRTDGRTDARTVTWLPNFLGLMVYQNFLPMVLRWRASRAGAPLKMMNLRPCCREKLQKIKGTLFQPKQYTVQDSICRVEYHGKQQISQSKQRRGAELAKPEIKYTLFQREGAIFIPCSRVREAKKHTLFSGTYLYSPFVRVPPPPPPPRD